LEEYVRCTWLLGRLRNVTIAVRIGRALNDGIVGTVAVGNLAKLVDGKISKVKIVTEVKLFLLCFF
jgi:hypothetical protein